MKIINRLAKLNWVTVVLSPLMVVLMEAFWLYAWFAWLGKWQTLAWQRPPLSLASLILLLGISFFATRFIFNQNWALRWTRLSIVAGGLVAIFIVVRIEYAAGFGLLSGQWFIDMGNIFLNSFSSFHPIMIAIPAGVYLWWHGISRGRSPLYISDIYRSFLVGIVALVILVIVWRASLGAESLESLASTIAPLIAAFFFFGLTALAPNPVWNGRRYCAGGDWYFQHLFPRVCRPPGTIY